MVVPHLPPHSTARAAALALALALSPSVARAFTRESGTGADGARGPCLYWGTRQLAFETNDKGSRDAGPGAFAAVSASFAAWAAPCTDLAFDDLGRTSRADIGFSLQDANRPALVVWRDVLCSKAAPPSDPCWAEGCANAYDCWEHDADVLALTTTSYNNKTGEIVHADIEFNGATYGFTAMDSPPCPKSPPPPRPAPCVAIDVQNTLTHEVGHLLGLDHSLDSEATMFKTADLGELKKRSPEADDLDGLCHLYPQGRPTSTCLSPPPGTLQSSEGGCHCGAQGGLTGLTLPLLTALLRRRRHPGCTRSSRAGRASIP